MFSGDEVVRFESDDNERYAALRDFPYSLIFKVYPDRIWVSCVSHHKRRPGYWRKRTSN